MKIGMHKRQYIVITIIALKKRMHKINKCKIGMKEKKQKKSFIKLRTKRQMKKKDKYIPNAPK